MSVPLRERMEKLVQENLGWLQGWFRGRVGDPELVHDLCQDAFVRALGQVSRLRDPERFPAWLYRIALNTLRDHLRSETRRRRRVQFTGQLEELEVPAETVDRLGQTEQAQKLLEAIRSLPTRLREPLLLRHSRGLSYAQIGKILGISENAVQVRIFRGRRKLRDNLKEMP